MKVLVTGSAGFIGFYVAERLLERGDEVVGLDSINDYYDVRLKYGRLKETGIDAEGAEYGSVIQSEKHRNYRFLYSKLEDLGNLEKLFESEGFDVVINLAAQAGVRYSLENPHAYAQSNVVGFLNILECCRHNDIKHLVFASSSSVYGLNESQPFKISDNVDHPISLYAATKKSNELMAHSYSHLYGLPVTGLRFFTVYGPWGRPDMAPMLFAKAITEGKPINVFNNGEMERDFTYIDDIVEGVVRVVDNPAKPDGGWTGENPNSGTSSAPYRLYNIGNSRPVHLMDFIATLEEALGRKAEKNMMPMQPGDVLSTYADVSDLGKDVGYKPSTDIKDGVKTFISWYWAFYS